MGEEPTGFKDSDSSQRLAGISKIGIAGSSTRVRTACNSGPIAALLDPVSTLLALEESVLGLSPSTDPPATAGGSDLEFS